MELEDKSKNKTYNERLCCSTETKNRIVNDCKEEFLKDNPEMRGIKLSHEFLLDRISKFYLKVR